MCSSCMQEISVSLPKPNFSLFYTLLDNCVYPTVYSTPNSTKLIVMSLELLKMTICRLISFHFSLRCHKYV